MKEKMYRWLREGIGQYGVQSETELEQKLKKKCDAGFYTVTTVSGEPDEGLKTLDFCLFGYRNSDATCASE